MPAMGTSLRFASAPKSRISPTIVRQGREFSPSASGCGLDRGLRINYGFRPWVGESHGLLRQPTGATIRMRLVRGLPWSIRPSGESPPPTSFKSDPSSALHTTAHLSRGKASVGSSTCHLGLLGYTPPCCFGWALVQPSTVAPHRLPAATEVAQSLSRPPHGSTVMVLFTSPISAKRGLWGRSLPVTRPTSALAADELPVKPVSSLEIKVSCSADSLGRPFIFSYSNFRRRGKTLGV